MIAIWFGKLAWDAAVRSGRVEVIGERQLLERLRSWFLLSPIRVAERPTAPRKTIVPPTVTRDLEITPPR